MFSPFLQSFVPQKRPGRISISSHSFRVPSPILLNAAAGRRARGPSVSRTERASEVRPRVLSISVLLHGCLGAKKRERRGRKKEKEDTKRPENFLPAELKGPSSSVGPPQAQSHLDRCWVKLATGCKKTFIHPSSNLSKVVGEVQQCAVCRRPFCSRVGATASKVVKEKMDDGSGTGAEQERRREGRAARQSGEKFETVPKLRGAQRRRGTSWRREGRPPTAKGIFHRPPGW